MPGTNAMRLDTNIGILGYASARIEGGLASPVLWNTTPQELHRTLLIAA